MAYSSARFISSSVASGTTIASVSAYIHPYGVPRRIAVCIPLYRVDCRYQRRLVEIGERPSAAVVILGTCRVAHVPILLKRFQVVTKALQPHYVDLLVGDSGLVAVTLQRVLRRCPEPSGGRIVCQCLETAVAIGHRVYMGNPQATASQLVITSL